MRVPLAESARRARLALALALTATVVACAGVPPVRVEPRPQEQVQASLDRSALTGLEPSHTTRWILRLLEAEDVYRDDPGGVLRRLQGIYAQRPTRNNAFAMAELAYLTAKREGSREWYLSAAVYAYAFLLDADAEGFPSPWDRRFRWACDIYNRSLLKAFAGDAGELALEGGRFRLPTGTLHVSVDTSDFPFTTEGLRLLVADGLDVVGLAYRVRDSGLGAPLVAVVQHPGDGSAGIGRDRTSVSATAFLRLEGGVADLAVGLQARIELHSTYAQDFVEVAGTRVPLEADLSTTVAFGTQDANLWSFDLRGFFRGQDAARENGLILPRPFEAGRIPVVFVHGTASNPSYWAEMLNSLGSDPELRARYQFWLFLYSSGSPIAYSAAFLREELTQLVALRDPEGLDEALRRMVIVGHSQGGLLAKMTVVELRAEDVLRQMTGTDMQELGLDAEQEALIRRLYDVEPLPFVERVVYIATPHQGSFLASKWYARMFAKMIAAPQELAGAADRLFRRIERLKLPKAVRPRLPTSLDNMDPGSPFLQVLNGAPEAEAVHLHSIIPIGRADPAHPEGANDGVVEYESAHLEGVDSERLVPSPHSCQAHPRTMVEMWRILREHAGLEQVHIRPMVTR